MKKFLLAALLAVPVALYFLVAELGSWQPRTLAAYNAPVRSVAFSPDGKRLASAGGDGSVTLWDAKQMRVERVLSAQSGKASGVAFSPRGDRIAASLDGFDNDEKGEAHLWDANSGALKRTWKDGRGMTGVAFLGDGRTLAASTYIGVPLWDVKTGKVRAGFSVGDASWVRGVALSPDGQTVVGLGGSSAIHWWDVRKASREDYWGEDHGIKGDCAAFSPDGKTLAVGALGHVVLYDVQRRNHQRNRRGKLSGQSTPVEAVAFSPDGTALAAGHANGVIEVWDVSARRIARPLRGHSRAVTSLSFAPDGNTLASGSEDGTLRLWRLR